MKKLIFHSRYKSTLLRVRFAVEASGTTFLGVSLHSEERPGSSIGSPDLWFDAMAALAHATNDSGAFGINRDTD